MKKEFSKIASYENIMMGHARFLPKQKRGDTSVGADAAPDGGETANFGTDAAEGTPEFDFLPVSDGNPFFNALYSTAEVAASMYSPGIYKAYDFARTFGRHYQETGEVYQSALNTAEEKVNVLFGMAMQIPQLSGLMNSFLSKFTEFGVPEGGQEIISSLIHNVAETMEAHRPTLNNIQLRSREIVRENVPWS